MDLLDTMKTVELFRGLDLGQIERLASIARAETYADGDTIVRYDQPGDSLYLLGGGQVEIILGDRSDDARPTLYLGAGQIFGEIALLDAGTRSATVRAVQDGTVVYRLPRDVLLSLCQQDTGLGFLIMRNLALDLSFKLRHRNFD